MVVKVGGMCCVISTGARSMTPPICATMVLSACGPPVDAPISRMRGDVKGGARSTTGACASPCSVWIGLTAPVGRGVRDGTGMPAGAALGTSGGAIGVSIACGWRRRLARSPRWRIFSIRSRWNSGEPLTSWFVVGFGM